MSVRYLLADKRPLRQVSSKIQIQIRKNFLRRPILIYLLGLTSTLYLLAKNAEYQERMRNEAKEILHDRDPEYADMAKCPLINAVAKESLRIYPPLIGFSRMSKEDCVVNGYHVPKGTMFSLLSLAAHKSPEFFEDPEAFKPERWISSDENENKINKAWLPFGVGKLPRTLIRIYFWFNSVPIPIIQALERVLETTSRCFK